MLDQLIDNGMDAARLNFSHGTHASHAAAIGATRRVAERRRVAVAIIQDLQGPRVRVGSLTGDGVEVRTGQSVRLRPWWASSDVQSAPLLTIPEIPVAHEHLARDLRPDARKLIDDGLIELVADHITGDLVECTVVSGGRVAAHTGVNLPGTLLNAPSLTGKD
jgi:pyruvate kinase